MSHAILSPSSASRWLACTPSARLELDFPDRSSEAAEEGTLAHKLGELLIRKQHGGEMPQYPDEIKAISAHKLFDHAMREHAENYAAFVLEHFAEAQAHTKDAVLFLEQKIDLTAYVPEGYGTTDANIIANHTLTIIDLKYGKGVPVLAVENKQMMLYALGALEKFDFLYDIEQVRMIIFQPRLDSITTYEMAVGELRHWAETELKPRARMAFNGEGEFVPGAHCRFCKARAMCKANAQMNLEIAVHDFKEPVLLTDEEISDILSRAKVFTDWLKSVEDYALAEAVNNGKKWPGYKLVAGKSNRKYADENKVLERLLDAGYFRDQVLVEKIKGITEMEKELGKKVFATHLNDLIIKPDGKPTLAPATDPRPEFNSVASAIEDFSDVDI